MNSIELKASRLIVFYSLSFSIYILMNLIFMNNAICVLSKYLFINPNTYSGKKDTISTSNSKIIFL